MDFSVFEMAEIEAWFHMKRWMDFDSDVSAVEDFNKPLDDLMAMRRPESPDSDVSSKSDQWKYVSPRRATGWLMSIESSDFGVPFRINRYSSLPRQGDFYLSEKEHDVSDDKDLVKSPEELRAERRAWLRKKMRATGSTESSDSDVSLKSDGSKVGLIDFKDRVSPRLDFSSSEEDDVSDDEDLVESPDDQGGDEPGAVV